MGAVGLMAVDEMGGVWLVQPLMVLLVGVAVYLLLGWAHVAEPRRPEVRQTRAVATHLADDLLLAVGRAAALPSRPRRRARGTAPRPLVVANRNRLTPSPAGGGARGF